MQRGYMREIIANMEETINAYKILICKTEAKRLLGTCGCRGKQNTKLYLG
jgi:hypothetical protein